MVSHTFEIHTPLISELLLLLQDVMISQNDINEANTASATINNILPYQHTTGAKIQAKTTVEGRPVTHEAIIKSKCI